MTIEVSLLMIALVSEAVYAVILAQSIPMPRRRLWPPPQIGVISLLLAWVPTVLLILAGLVLGVMDWNGMGWPASLRWGVGLPLLILGNVVVWSAVFNIGVGATSGAAGQLKTDGFYRWSRNPQYVADMLILVGWTILSASAWTIPIALGGIVVLALAPFAEEPWLRAVYGDCYLRYCRRTRRFFGRARPGTKECGPDSISVAENKL